jgi:DNA-binding SARP family transcriptional activator
VAIERAGERLEGGLPGRQGRRCFVYLAAHRARPVQRDELIDAVWTGTPPPAADAALSALASKLRRALGADALAGRGELRRELDSLYLRGLETYGEAALGLGGAELAAAERAGRELAHRARYREAGHRLLMRALVARGNPAEALAAYEALRVLLREELGIGPSTPTKELHLAILGS